MSTSKGGRNVQASSCVSACISAITLAVLTFFGVRSVPFVLISAIGISRMLQSYLQIAHSARNQGV